jgi:hypothetical protein
MGRSCSVAWKALVRWTVSAVGLREVRFPVVPFRLAVFLPLVLELDFEDGLAVFDPVDFVVDFFLVELLVEDFPVDVCEEEVWGAISRTPAQDEPVSREPSSAAV